MTPSRRVVHAGLSVGVTAIAFGGAWYYTATSDSYLVVSIPDMLQRFREVWLFDRFTSDALPSLKYMILGYLLALVSGVGLGLGIGLSAMLRALTMPMVSFMRAIPPITLLLPAMVVLGIGASMRLFIIAFVCIWPILLNTADGVAELNRTMLSSARAYGVGGVRRLFYVILPAVSPRIFTGMRTSLTFALLLMITSEMVASVNGIGAFLIQAQQSFRIPDMWAAVILLGLLGIGLNFLLTVLERRVLHWHLRTENR